MDRFFECTLKGERFVGLDWPISGSKLRLFHMCKTGVREILAAIDFDVSRFKAAVIDKGRKHIVDRDEEVELFFLPPLFPEESTQALVSGFGVSHKVKMPPTKAQKKGSEDAYPSWFFKGLGGSLKANGQPLTVPNGAVAICEEAEIVLVYVVDGEGLPRYAGFTFGNDLTDLGQVKRNPSHLSYAKLCDCAVAPQLFLGAPPSVAQGAVTIERDDAAVWNGRFTTGTEALFYPLDTMMRQLWSHGALRVPGLVHYVFIGADKNSFDFGFRTLDGDRISIDVISHGIRLSNRIARQSRCSTQRERSLPE